MGDNEWTAAGAVPVVTSAVGSRSLVAISELGIGMAADDLRL
jgi:hypothetical protein